MILSLWTVAISSINESHNFDNMVKQRLPLVQGQVIMGVQQEKEITVHLWIYSDVFTSHIMYHSNLDCRFWSKSKPQIMLKIDKATNSL